MDIRFYFEPVDFNKHQNQGPLNWKHTLGSIIEKNTTSFSPSNTRNLQIAIIGAPFDSSAKTQVKSDFPDKIRTELYQLANTGAKINIADFGNLKPAISLKGNYQAIRDITDYFNELKVTTIILGGSQDLTTGICEAFQKNSFFSLTVIDSLLNTKKGREPVGAGNFLSSVFNTNPSIFQFNLVGYQSHFVPAVSFAKTQGVNQHIRLGIIRDNINHAEPVFRNSDVVSFDLGAIKISEAPGTLCGTANGLRSEEACQLAKFAGLSNRVKSFGLFGIDPQKEHKPQTIQLASQIVWYFTEGYQNRDAGPDKTEELLSYQVHMKGVEYPVIFLKNQVTGQWWMEFESYDNKKLHVACTNEDYLQATENEIPEIWMKFIQKIDEIVKYSD
jgi:arginase family enzyme